MVPFRMSWAPGRGVTARRPPARSVLPGARQSAQERPPPRPGADVARQASNRRPAPGNVPAVLV